MNLIRLKECVINLDNVTTINYDSLTKRLYVIGSREKVSSIIHGIEEDEAEEFFTKLENKNKK